MSWCRRMAGCWCCCCARPLDPVRRAGGQGPLIGTSRPSSAVNYIATTAPVILPACMRTFIVSRGWMVLWLAARAIAPASTSWNGFSVEEEGAVVVADMAAAFAAPSACGEPERTMGVCATARQQHLWPPSPSGSRQLKTITAVSAASWQARCWLPKAGRATRARGLTPAPADLWTPQQHTQHT